MGDSEQISKNLRDSNYSYNKNGHKVFAKGNNIGKMKKKGFSLADLHKVIIDYEKTHDQRLLKHYVEQLMVDNNLLSKFIDKNVPTKNINEVTGKDGSPLTFIIEKSYNKPEGEVIDKKEV